MSIKFTLGVPHAGQRYRSTPQSAQTEKTDRKNEECDYHGCGRLDCAVHAADYFSVYQDHGTGAEAGQPCAFQKRGARCGGVPERQPGAGGEHSAGNGVRDRGGS